MKEGKESRESKELRRVRSGPAPGERPDGIAIETFIARCPGNAEAVLSKSKELMEVVLRFGCKDWPSDAEWLSLLPAWFIEACAPETSDEEAEHFFESWTFPSREEQSEIEWRVLGWVSWMHPEERSWSWWDATVSGPNQLLVTIATSEWPYSWPVLCQLLRAAGGHNVSSADESPTA